MPSRFSRGQALNTKRARKITSAYTSTNLDICLKITSAYTSATLDIPASAFHLTSGELKRGRATHNTTDYK
jgi:hypothetical protein